VGKERIWLSPPHIGDNEMKYVQEAFNSNWIAPVGPQLNKFEETICELTGVNHSVALSSGTAAIHLALIALGIGPGDEVIVSTLTFAGSVNPIIYQQAVPVFVDSEEATANICPTTLEDTIKVRLANGKKPKAMIIVHLYGMPANMDPIMELSQKYEIPVIEDAAEALGASYDNKALGSFGKAGVFSFNGNKIITTSGGGCLISNDLSLIEKARKLSTQARDPAPHYQHSEVGYNYRMSNVCAAIGLGQLDVLSKRVAQRRKVFDTYFQHLQDIEAIKFTTEPDEKYYSNHWLTWIKIDPSKSKRATPGRIITSLKQANIEARPLWKPMHLQPVFSSYPYYGRHFSEKLFATSLCLPSGSNLRDDQLELIISLIRGCF